MTKRKDPLIGRAVTINADAEDRKGDRHHLAGQAATVLARTAGGSYQLAVGESVSVLPMDAFTVTSPGDAVQTSEQTGTSLALLAHSAVVSSPTNPRTHFDPDFIQELALSIKLQGVAQPILVRPLPGARLGETWTDRRRGDPLPTHEIVAGEQRWRACGIAGVRQIPALIRQLTDTEVLELQLVENLKRRDLHPMEEAEGYEKLMASTDMRAEDIAERIGKSRSYVYTTLKLLSLCSEGRKALFEGKINRSIGLLIARIPDEGLQHKALEEAAPKGFDGEVVSERQFKRWLQMNVMLRLANATFDIKDETLRKEAGACGDCPKRTGANPDLFSDVEGPDVCIDPACFHAKEAAQSERLVARAREKGMTVIEGKEALELKPQHYNVIKGYAQLDSDIREALSERELKGKVVLFVDPHDNEPMELVPIELAQKAYAKARARIAPATETPKEREKREAYQAKEKRQELVRDYQKRWRDKAIAAILPRVEAGEVGAIPPALLRRVILELSGADQRCNEEDAAASLGLDHYDDELIASTVRATDDGELAKTVMLVLLRGDRIAQFHWNDGEHVVDDSAPTIEALAAQLGISLDDIKAQVQAQIRAERAPEDQAAAEPVEPKPKARKGKTTKAEASAAIAGAMAGAENPNSFEVGQMVRVKIDLRQGFNVLHTSGLQAEIMRRQGDRAWWVQPEGMSIEVTADYTELEPLPEAKEEPPAKDDRYGEARTLVLDEGRASISLIQRHLKIGHMRAERLLYELMADNVVAATDGGGWHVVGATA